ncbi:response regulator transcription factor [Clostridium beijerinckii]|uniref:Stage 0 sporulation protein A homolog n=1 Tax=Clostridium beijerinckii TaxID=1520 RepID=A0AAX0B437_CLOBE|nr:response regulator transcription factor [Clostridium beijerinckii]NRT33014.1 DNA-binding response OmpR family regulator [Clostridium beijerinckii]NRT47561.1 DNA-binding response OmpR family regulator [Clostridium beijerinckii]NRT75304.1 DNA-binding response OmpR family regulator [Clostridium beijerinckii]NRT89682.1 DNA-binding response OmpR family regulator [Clostridium beijerinckii]NRZ24149.1 DNA-binding response OmpR family regulator [Clostridium beijerinckii]
MSKKKILIVDDEYDIRNIVSIYLENNDFETVQAESGHAALEIIDKDRIDLAILDVMMPDMDGITLCIKIREKTNMPIIMLSAKDQDMDKVIGLTCGADDYIAKPFNPIELLARVRAQLRRFIDLNPVQINSEVLKYDDFTLNLSTHKLIKKDEEVRLTPTEFKILKLLWINKGIVFSTEKIFEKIWGEEEFEVDNTVMVHIRNLRDKIEEDNRNPKYIKTVWGVGYKFGD